MSWMYGRPDTIQTTRHHPKLKHVKVKGTYDTSMYKSLSFCCIGMILGYKEGSLVLGDMLKFVWVLLRIAMKMQEISHRNFSFAGITGYPQTVLIERWVHF